MSKQRLSKTQVQHIAKLAELNLTPEEIKTFQKQLSQILDYFKLLKELDTSQVKATHQVTGLKNITRKDEARPSLPVTKTLKNAPEKHNQYFQIKSIF